MLQSFAVKAALVVAGLLAAVGLWFVASRWATGPWVDKSEPVTVMSATVARARGRYIPPSYLHRVRTDNGAEHQMVFDELLPKGTRVWVNYRYYLTSKRTRLTFYYRCDKRC